MILSKKNSQTMENFSEKLEVEGRSLWQDARRRFMHNRAAIASLVQLTWYLRRRVGPLEGGRMLNTLWRVSAAASLAAVVSALALRGLGDTGHAHPVAQAGMVAALLALALGVGYAAMKVLRVEELATVEQLVRSVTRRLRGR